MQPRPVKVLDVNITLERVFNFFNDSENFQKLILKVGRDPNIYTNRTLIAIASLGYLESEDSYKSIKNELVEYDALLREHSVTYRVLAVRASLKYWQDSTSPKKEEEIKECTGHLQNYVNQYPVFKGLIGIKDKGNLEKLVEKHFKEIAKIEDYYNFFSEQKEKHGFGKGSTPNDNDYNTILEMTMKHLLILERLFDPNKGKKLIDNVDPDKNDISMAYREKIFKKAQEDIDRREKRFREAREG